MFVCICRDNEALRQWRGETKQLQNEKYREAYIYGGAKHPVDVAKRSPFDVSNEHMKVPTNEERIAVIISCSFTSGFVYIGSKESNFTSRWVKREFNVHIEQREISKKKIAFGFTFA